ncbi:MAG: 4Fe-4S binding protein [Bacteroidetes bacterium]|nr:4Fe-4S binding protein [Bacteroidota bacterium]
MMPTQPVFTEKNDCQDCYKCIRECPVKAIRCEGESAFIIHEMCIFCGHCTQICPAGAKKVRNDLSRAKMLVRTHKNVIVSIAPSWVSEFSEYSASAMISALKNLGFNLVSETALGAEEYSRQSAEFLSENDNGVWISSACPSVVDFVTKYFPHLANRVVPFHSPMMMHAKLLRREAGDDTHIVFIGPCVAKKTESDEFNKDIDTVLTFKDLRFWLENEGIFPETLETDEHESFYPHNAYKGSLYPVDGGMITSIKTGTGATEAAFMTFSGIDNIRQALEGLDNFTNRGVLFLELMACEGGCINGPGCSKNGATALKRLDIISQTNLKIPMPAASTSPLIDKELVMRNFDNHKPVSGKIYSEKDIEDALRDVGKLSPRDELNCGGCGYNSCRDFARALLDRKAETSMCVSYMRRVAHNKASVLIQKIPSGVVIVDQNLRIVESNKSFAHLLGEEAEMIFDVNPGLPGADLRKLVSFHKLFASVLVSGQDMAEHDVKEQGKLLHVSVVSIQKNRIVCGIIRDLQSVDVKDDELIKRTRKVISENLSTVQKVAYLLGENASRTEAMLNSIIEIRTKDFPDEE